MVEGLDLKPPTHLIKGRVYADSLYDLFLLLTVMVNFEKGEEDVKADCVVRNPFGWSCTAGISGQDPPPIGSWSRSSVYWRHLFKHG